MLTRFSFEKKKIPNTASKSANVHCI